MISVVKSYLTNEMALLPLNFVRSEREGNSIMHATFVRIMTTTAFAMTLLTPLNTSAGPLSPSQMSSLSARTGDYFRALYKLDYPALTELAAPDFVIVKNGKSFGIKLADQIQAARLTLIEFSGKIRIDSASSSGGTVTEVVSPTVRALPSVKGAAVALLALSTWFTFVDVPL